MPVIQTRGGARAKPPKDRGSPILLFAEATINPGEFATLNVEALRNNTTSYIEVHEIRFAGRAAGNSADVLNIGAGFVDVDLKLGKVKLTNNPISTGLLTRAEGGGWNGATPSIVNGSFSAVNRLKLARPIVLAPGEMIETTLYHRSIVDYPLAARIAFVGRALPAAPAERRWLPYFASFQRSVQLQTTGTASDTTVVTSTEKDLVNATGKLIRVERIAGRLAFYKNNTLSTGKTISEILELAQAGEAYFDSTVRITDSRGFNFALNSPVSAVFDPSRRSWEAKFNLPANGYLITQTTIPGTTALAYAQVGYALIGYREV